MDSNTKIKDINKILAPLLETNSMGSPSSFDPLSPKPSPASIASPDPPTFDQFSPPYPPSEEPSPRPPPPSYEESMRMRRLREQPAQDFQQRSYSFNDLPVVEEVQVQQVRWTSDTALVTSVTWQDASSLQASSPSFAPSYDSTEAGQWQVCQVDAKDFVQPLPWQQSSLPQPAAGQNAIFQLVGLKDYRRLSYQVPQAPVVEN